MSNSFDNAKEHLTEYLVSKKMSKTPARYAILEYIYSSTSYFNAEALYKAMQQKYHVSYATIYNTLNILLDCNLIIKYHYDNEQSQFYEKATNNAFHHLLVCSECGAVKEFTDVRLRNTIHARMFKGFKAMRHSLTIYGICNKCAQKQRKKNKQNKDKSI